MIRPHQFNSLFNITCEVGEIEGGGKAFDWLNYEQYNKFEQSHDFYNFYPIKFVRWCCSKAILKTKRRGEGYVKQTIGLVRPYCI